MAHVHLVRDDGVQDYTVAYTVGPGGRAWVQVRGQPSEERSHKPPTCLFSPQVIVVRNDGVASPPHPIGRLGLADRDGVASVVDESWLAPCPVYREYVVGMDALRKALRSRTDATAAEGARPGRPPAGEATFADVVQVGPGIAVKRIVWATGSPGAGDMTCRCLDQRGSEVIQVRLETKRGESGEHPQLVRETVVIRPRAVPLERTGAAGQGSWTGTWLRDEVTITTTYTRVAGLGSSVPKSVEWRNARGEAMGTITFGEYQVGAPLPEAADSPSPPGGAPEGAPGESPKPPADAKGGQ